MNEIPGLSDKEADRIARYIAVEALPDSADLAFVFGSHYPDPAYIAADLLRRGLVHYAVLTGGKNRVTGEVEALMHLEILVGESIPPERVIVEQASSNTLENVVFAWPEIAARMAVSDIRSVIAVTKWYHSRRALMTLKRHLFPGVRYYAATYEPDGYARENWHHRPEVARRVLKEWQNIPRYLERGDIAEIYWDGDAFQ
jgi:uncharacterized SAM-binding protein YcdF (DUF218 family)